jgi:hypothetical protein
MPNLQDKTILKRIIADIETNQNRERKIKDWDSNQIYSGNQRTYTENALRTIFPESHVIMRVSNVNLLKKVVDKKAKVYNDAPRRLVDGVENDNLNMLYDEGLFNRSFAQMDTIFNRSKCALLWVQNDPEFKTKFNLKVLNQYSFDLVIDNDTNEVKMVILSYPSRDITNRLRVEGDYSNSHNEIIAESQYDSAPESKTYSIWTAEEHITIQAKRDELGIVTQIDYIDDNLNPEGVNPLGMLPFAFITAQPDIPEFPTPSELPHDSIEINILGSNLLTATQMQIGQLVLKYPEGSKINTIFKGFRIALELPQSKDNEPLIKTEAEYIVPNSDIAGMRDTMHDYAASILADHGLEGAALTGSNEKFTSGFERLIASASVINIQKENSNRYQEVESAVFEIIKKYDEINGTRLFNAEQELNVHYKDPKVIRSELETLDIVERKEELGLLEPFEKFIIDDPTLSKENAMEKQKRIEVLNANNNRGFQEPNIAGQDQREDQFEERIKGAIE